MDFFFKRKDIILWTAVILIVTGSLFLMTAVIGDAGSTAVVSIDGTEYATFPLFDDRTELITGHGGLTCTLEIHDGSANVTHADCPDRICVSHRQISNVGESIVCLPARIIVRITGEFDDSALDTISR